MSAVENSEKFYIGGQWVEPLGAARLDVIDPSTELSFATIALGTNADVDHAVAAARSAFASFSRTSVDDRINLLEKILKLYNERAGDLATTVSREMGAPRDFALEWQVGVGRMQLEKIIEALRNYPFFHPKGSSAIVKEPVGVVGLITPWNWPLLQTTCKIGPALASGSTMVLKPSEIAPLTSILLAQILHDAGVPKGVFNLVNGDGPTVGQAIASHPEVDMVSFTGSTRAGILIAKTAADTVKRVHQELGGKSANILLPDVDLDKAVTGGVAGCFGNSGQSCNAPTRMLIPREKLDAAEDIARKAAESYVTGPADRPGVQLGPVVSEAQYLKVQDLIESGIREGAKLVTGGPGRPDGLNGGYFVKPTVFSSVDPSMRIAREEIFGPVLTIIPYDDVEHAITIANDTIYGLAAHIQSANIDTARQVAMRIRTGTVQINYPQYDPGIPFGGYKQSGNGRENAEFGLEDYLETKGIVGYTEAANVQ